MTTLPPADESNLRLPDFHSFNEDGVSGVELIQSDLGVVSSIAIPDSMIRRLAERLITYADRKNLK
jgi:hypothetical protein